MTGRGEAGRRKRAHVLAGATIEIPRWLLTVMYACTALIGVFIALLYSPTFTQHTSDALTTVWGVLMAASAVGSAVVSVRERGEPVERWTSMFLSSLLLAFAFVPIRLAILGDLDVATYSTIAFVLSLVPSARCVALIVKTGRRNG